MGEDTEPYIGQRLFIGHDQGTIRYIGPIELPNKIKNKTNDDKQDRTIWVGVEWEDAFRGKNSGDVNGTYYFKTNIPGSGSFLKYSKFSSLNVQLGTKLENILKLKYEKPNDSSDQLIDFCTKNDRSGNVITKVQTVGWNDIYNRISQLDKLAIVDLSYSNIYYYSPKALINLTPSIIDLDLCNNKIDSWDIVFNVCKDLPKLKQLSISYNPLPNLTNDILSGLDTDTQLALSKIEIFNLTSTNQNENSLELISKYFTGLIELHLELNNLSTINKDLGSGFNNLKVLYLSNNMMNWNSIIRFASLNKLEKLYVENNKIDFISIDENEWKNLKFINLNSNCINNWDSIIKLNCFTNLTELRIKNNPVLSKTFINSVSDDNDYPNNKDDIRCELIARLSKLKLINSSEIPDRERQDSEIYYLNSINKLINNNSNHENLLKDLRVIELQKKYDYIFKREDNTCKRNIQLILEYNNKKMLKRFSNKYTVGELKSFLRKLFKNQFSNSRIQLLYDNIELVNDLKSLNDYNLRDKSTIQISFV